MNILKKSLIIIIFILLSGCAHHSAYNSGYSNIGAVRVGIDSYFPRSSYPVYYGRDSYKRRYKRHEYSAYKPYYNDNTFANHYEEKYEHDEERYEHAKHYSRRKQNRYDRNYGHNYRREHYDND